MTRLAIAGMALLGCSFSINTNSATDSAGQSLKQKEVARAATKPETLKEDTDAGRDDQQRTLEEHQRSECWQEIVKLHEMRFPPPSAEVCSDSGIPAGTYETAEGALPWVKLEVSESGCAAYEAYTYRDGTVTKEYAGAEGTWTRDYQRRFECTVGGTLSAQRYPKHRRYSGNCLRKIFDVLSEDTPWTVVKGSEPIVVASVSDKGDKKPRTVRLTRVSPSVEQVGGVSRLFAKQQVESDDQARVSVAFARPAPGQSVGCPGLALGDPRCKKSDESQRREWCSILEHLRATSANTAPTQAQRCNEAREWEKALGTAAPIPKCLCDGIPDERGWVARTVGCLAD
jgi:hypothetical protein